ncbi:CHAP domain-containing protein [Actinokineospora auranticolor]|uniref:PPE family protein n=1 Tax=Actinokineospora auranticolor TaxID=155976 RepID=A0A2S6GG27_9PSEU|nr:CHAP domain-containing protein [Actinokineospora auranticolor]PPK64188.1 PPE family protein [Actinokineospora auranticolor]
MDTRQVARHFAAEMIEHRNRLAGKVGDAVEAEQAFTTVHTRLTEHQDNQRKSTSSLLSEWQGKASDGFAHQADRYGKYLESTADNAKKAARITKNAAHTLDAGHTAVTRLLDEYTEKAVRVLDAGLAVGQKPLLLRAVAQVADLVQHYTAESTKHVAEVRSHLEAAATHLRSLHSPPPHPHSSPSSHPSPSPSPKGNHPNHSTASRITHTAATQLGYREGSNNANKYGPQASWCSSFATWVWRRSGVNIPLYPFTGDVFRWGQGKNLAYHDLDKARPGDVLLFGTGPQSPQTSKHIGIVEKVDGTTVTLIEGNSGPNTDSVVRRTHPLSHNTFYGGVHPS